MKATRILAISVLVLVVGLPAGVEAYGNVEKYWSLDSNDDTWLLLSQWLDGRRGDAILDDVACSKAAPELNIDGVTGESKASSPLNPDGDPRPTITKASPTLNLDGVPRESISVGGGGGVPTESVGEADAADCFLNIDGVLGESTDEAHADWIEVMSFSHGVSQTAGGDRSTGGAATAGRCDVQDMSITKELDKASATLNTQTDRQTGEAMPWGWLEQMRPRKDPRIETFPLPE